MNDLEISIEAQKAGNRTPLDLYLEDKSNDEIVADIEDIKKKCVDKSVIKEAIKRLEGLLDD